MMDFDPDALDIPAGHYIDAARVAAPDALDVRRPSDGRAYGRLALADEAMVARAAESARRAFRRGTWSRIAPRERGRVMRRWADLIERDAIAVARLEAVGSTRLIREVIGWDVPHVADIIRFYGELVDKHGGEVKATASRHLGMTVAEPYGVVAAIAPWNYPLVIAAWKVAPAIAAGNAVILKPSEMTPYTAIRLAELAAEAGLPQGIFNVVQGDGPTTGEALVRHCDVGKVTFTGSTAAGARIMALAAGHGLKPVTLELGGKSPQLVLADADLALASRSIARSILSNAGQVCVAGSRLVADRSIADDLIERLVAAMSQIAPGPTWHGATNYSPIVSRRQLDRIDRLVRESIDSGAEAVIGGRTLAGHGDGCFFSPTILTGVKAESVAVREEVFGPVLTVETFESLEEGVALAAHPDYGLAAGVYTRDISKALGAMRDIEAGTVWINRYGRSDDLAIPTGGFKRSGFGKDLGREAFEANLRFKSVLIDIAP
ncbi:MAG: aldehyde dehydrogenase family protein [Rhizobiales bacterium]|nr:aldehyde dehydrogenase family protein [Hyphomicrobiales bacterium]